MLKMLPRPWHLLACRPRSCDGERRSMRRPRPGIELPFHLLTTTDDRSERAWFDSFYRFFLNKKPGCPCHLTPLGDPRPAIHDSDTQNGYRKSGSRLTEIGCPTQVGED